MDKLACIRAFAKVIEQGSFSEAAREMGLSRSAGKRGKTHGSQAGRAARALTISGRKGILGLPSTASLAPR